MPKRNNYSQLTEGTWNQAPRRPCGGEGRPRGSRTPSARPARSDFASHPAPRTPRPRARSGALTGGPLEQRRPDTRAGSWPASMTSIRYSPPPLKARYRPLRGPRVALRERPPQRERAGGGQGDLTPSTTNAVRRRIKRYRVGRSPSSVGRMTGPARAPRSGIQGTGL